VEVAPEFGGTGEYTLTAFDSGGQVVATKSVTRTEDPGDPADQGFGYFTIDLGPLPGPARSFILTNRFIRSSLRHSHVRRRRVSVLRLRRKHDHLIESAETA
jgi:hypothetical protein